jgi:glycosyltransferase involved in cell wall biosynthesis
LPDWELIIVDDGSTDETANVATSFARKSTGRIRVVSQTNSGLANARNAGILAARGRYILPLDADDFIARDMLAVTTAALDDRPDIAIAYTDERTFGEIDSEVQTIEFDRFTLPAVNEFCYCSLYRREVWESVGGYNPNLIHGYEDWDFWIGAVDKGYKALRVPGAFFHYRVRSGSMSEGAKRHDRELRQQIRENHPRLFRPWLRAARSIVLAIQRISPTSPFFIRKFRSSTLRLMGRRWR